MYFQDTGNKCWECGDEFANKFTLRNHMKNMHSETARCSRCEMTLKDKYSLSLHIKKCVLFCEYPNCKHLPFLSKIKRNDHVLKVHKK